MGIKGIDHWVIVAGDLGRTLDFYQGLGFTIAWEKRPGRPDMATIRISDAQKINVHGADAPARPGYLGAGQPTVGGADFCLEWDGTVDEVLALLKRNGVVPVAGPGPRTCARGPSTSVYFRDPDENLVELTVYDRRPPEGRRAHRGGDRRRRLRHSPSKRPVAGPGSSSR